MFSQFTTTQKPREFAEKYPEIKHYCFMDHGENKTTFDVRDSTDKVHAFD
jgi:hypothetical protein